jgi:glutaredoxin-like YruB-family protein
MLPNISGDAMKKVTLYSTPVCPFCIMAKDFLKKNKVEFKDCDVSENSTWLKEMVKKSGQTGVPVFDIDGKIIVGFNEGVVRKALGL